LQSLGDPSRRYRAHRDLGRNFSVRSKVHENHVLVTAGVYKYVRHPVYAALWLHGVAQALRLPNWLAGSASLVGFALLFASRVEREEQMMIETFGEDYRAYVARMSRLAPWLY
jgi:protein-S-isoprenylcysteine O-methyltransferase Ste14